MELSKNISKDDKIMLFILNDNKFIFKNKIMN